MKTNYLSRLAIAALCLPFSSALYAASYDGQTVAQIQFDSRSCMFFNLNGVPTADSSVSSANWFAVPKSMTTYQEITSMILSSKLSGKKIYLSTDGTSSCGYATASTVGFD